MADNFFNNMPPDYGEIEPNVYVEFVKNEHQQMKMKELQLTAEAYYQAVSSELKANADKFIREMDRDGNEEIECHEYISYMKDIGCEKMANPEFFKKLNVSGSGRLKLVEVVTLYYVIYSRRPFCDGCNAFMDGVFFTCTDCFNGAVDKTFDVCPSCFKDKTYRHSDAHKHFVDNYALLEIKRMEALEEKEKQGKNERTNDMVSSAQVQPTTSTSTAIVPFDCQRKISLFSLASSLTGIVAGVTSIIANCSIM